MLLLFIFDVVIIGVAVIVVVLFTSLRDNLISLSVGQTKLEFFTAASKQKQKQKQLFLKVLEVLNVEDPQRNRVLRENEEGLT